MGASRRSCNDRFAGTTPASSPTMGHQLVAKGFKAFIHMAGMTHAWTPTYNPQSNATVEMLVPVALGHRDRPKLPGSRASGAAAVAAFVHTTITSRSTARWVSSARHTCWSTRNRSFGAHPCALNNNARVAPERDLRLDPHAMCLTRRDRRRRRGREAAIKSRWPGWGLWSTSSAAPVATPGEFARRA